MDLVTILPVFIIISSAPSIHQANDVHKQYNFQPARNGKQKKYNFQPARNGKQKKYYFQAAQNGKQKKYNFQPPRNSKQKQYNFQPVQHGKQNKNEGNSLNGPRVYGGKKENKSEFADRLELLSIRIEVCNDTFSGTDDNVRLELSGKVNCKTGWLSQDGDNFERGLENNFKICENQFESCQNVELIHKNIMKFRVLMDPNLLNIFYDGLCLSKIAFYFRNPYTVHLIQQPSKEIYEWTGKLITDEAIGEWAKLKKVKEYKSSIPIENESRRLYCNISSELIHYNTAFYSPMINKSK